MGLPPQYGTVVAEDWRRSKAGGLVVASLGPQHATLYFSIGIKCVVQKVHDITLIIFIVIFPLQKWDSTLNIRQKEPNCCLLGVD